MINTTKMSHPAFDQDQAIIRALSSITPDQANAIVAIVQASGQAWDVHTVDDYDGYLSILIEPTVSHDEPKTFFISGTAKRLELFEAHDDDLALIGTFTKINPLERQLASLLG